MLSINLHPLKHSYVKLFCESNFAPILEFAIFDHFRHIFMEISYIFSEFLVICVYFNKTLLHLKKLLQTIFRGYLSVFFTLIINIEGKYCFLVHFWYQTFIVLVLVISILTLDMSVNNQ